MRYSDYVDKEKCSTTAEQIIKIVRDYHLVEDKPDYIHGSSINFNPEENK